MSASGVSERPGTEEAGEALRSWFMRVGHGGQPSSWHVARQELGVGGPDSAGLDDPDSQRR